MSIRRTFPAALSMIVVTLLIAGCSVLPFVPSPRGRPMVDPRPRVITGVDAQHAMITEPLTETIPERTGTFGKVVMTVGPAPVMLGIEGTLFFLAAASLDGTKVADRIATDDTETWLPAGQYTLQAYYRTCDGSCALLDPAVEFCHVDAHVAASGTYVLAVTWSNSKASCTFGPRPAA
jgi:hypothetical protein